MSKARTLANLISDNAELADGQISVAEVVGAAPLASPSFTGTASGTFSGPLTGNVTGNLTGNVNTTLIASPTLNATVNIKTTDANGEGIGLGIDADKKVRFYDDQGVNTKMYWNASTVTQKFEDNSKLAFGSSEDLKLYHDGINKLVGDLTQTGKLTTDATDLSALTATISDTAVDVFVYDTSKDSDGGAWRKRTQNTSWYNETLNTATRGSRKEFPAVAVIVAESNQVTIYDGDDPDLPMWMVASEQTNDWSWVGFATNGSLNTVSMLNGVLVTGSGGDAASRRGSTIADFVKDEVTFVRASYRRTLLTIADRNSGISDSLPTAQPDIRIVDSNVNDVAMTVLPNAPIDAATGLPVPTIAVATNGGVSVIKDDGTVVDITGASTYTSSTDVSFTDNNKIAYTLDNKSSTFAYRVDDIPSSDFSATNTIYQKQNSLVMSYNENGPASLSDFYTIPNTSESSRVHVGDRAIGSSKGLTIPDVDYNNTYSSQMAFITSSYNSGWQNRLTKLATLSDTDDTNVTGSELVDQTSSGWSKPTGYSHNGSGTLTGASNTGQYSKAHDVITSFVVGEVYTVTLNVTAKSGSWSFWVNDSTSYPSNWTGTNEISGTGVKSHTFTASDTTGYVVFQCNALGNTITVSDISVRLAEEDRSVNGNGLQVFGTVTKTAVATGADLMAYSGFSSSNYLQQPYNADLNFGTGEYAFIIWFNKPSDGNYTTIATRGTSDSAESMRVAVSNAGVYFDYGDGSAYAQTNIAVPLAVWNCLVCTAKAGQLGHVYLNGVEQTYSTQSGVPATFLTATDYTLIIGKSYNNAQPWGGSLALARISATIPSPEQIDKIYNDEKVLFQDGAQATLYGTADAVTALAHDDTTDLLHVGTSAGRSVFQGLRRVDNTTDAVGAAISASNGLVAED
jgi:hypothetical protein